MITKKSKKLSLEALELLLFPDESDNPVETCDNYDSDFDFEDDNGFDSACG